MLERHNDELGHEMILVSRTGVVVFILFSLLMTGLLMGLFMFVDFDSILGRKGLAMKVGQTSISMNDFAKIKNISGKQAQAMPDQVWADELFKTLILAEDARQQGLDQNSELREKVERFNSALNQSQDSDRIARAIFLYEELAKAAIEKMLETNSDFQKLAHENTRTAVVENVDRLHLRTICVPDEDILNEVLSKIASGSSFEQINASFSISPYRGVGGDIGWKSASDFPENVFDRLQTASDEEIVEGFRDQSGIHLFAVTSRPERTLQISNARQLQEMRNKLISQHLVRLRSTIDFWINPTLRVMCQITPEPGRSN